MAKKKTNVTVDASLTLAGLTEKYAAHMERDGKSGGTIFSYTMELKAAQAELGAEMLVSALTAEQIEKFNRCKRVTKLKSGKPKSQLSIDKTRRVLRLALAWAEQSGLIEKSPIAPKGEPAQDDAPAKKPRKSRVVVEEREPSVPVEAPAESVVAETAA